MNLNFGTCQIGRKCFSYPWKAPRANVIATLPWGDQEVEVLVHKYRCSYYICMGYRIVVRHVVVVVIILIEYKSVP